MHRISRGRACVWFAGEVCPLSALQLVCVAAVAGVRRVRGGREDGYGWGGWAGGGAYGQGPGAP